MTKKMDAKTTRLIKWSEDVLLRLLKQIVAKRKSWPATVAERVKPNEARFSTAKPSADIKESIVFPRYKQVKTQQDPDSITLDPVVVQQLHDLLAAIAAKYDENQFHCFEHAAHVSMSVVKLLSRIVDPSSLSAKKEAGGSEQAMMLHEQSFGIASDPLTHFSCVFAALIHDIGHPGVPNAQLVQEQNELATQYDGKCINEQHSINVAWNLLFQKEYAMLRHTIYETDGELLRFRQIVVNTILATDFFDMEFKAARNHRWERAFGATALKLTSHELSNRKATIALEHLLQASDVSHTMQHWHIYRKWNERYFLECYEAYIDGRADKNPAEDWYEGEIRFFDFNVIPLAHKLKECGVFGVSSDEYLNYAMRNRQEWEKRGCDVVQEMVARMDAQTKFPLKPSSTTPTAPATSSRPVECKDQSARRYVYKVPTTNVPPVVAEAVVTPVQDRPTVLGF
jgi:3'5'-cyclic nucleotide phosphodiesterase